MRLGRLAACFARPMCFTVFYAAEAIDAAVIKPPVGRLAFPARGFSRQRTPIPTSSFDTGRRVCALTLTMGHSRCQKGAAPIHGLSPAPSVGVEVRRHHCDPRTFRAGRVGGARSCRANPLPPLHSSWVTLVIGNNLLATTRWRLGVALHRRGFRDRAKPGARSRVEQSGMFDAYMSAFDTYTSRHAFLRKADFTRGARRHGP
jgi:hypothetical protein